MASGDKNTRFFHAYANSRKQINSIWDITKEYGTVITSKQGLQKEAVEYFQHIFKARSNLTISNQLAVTRNYPRIFLEEEGLRLAEPINLSEILTTLKEFKASKSPRPDGWTVEFYLGFYENLGKDLLAVVEESCMVGHLHPTMNSIFISLIPKTDTPKDMNDFRPISLCNFIYQIVEKVISKRVKKILSKSISKE